MINLEKEIREQPAALAKVLGDNMPTVDAIVKEAKDSGVNGIYFAARGTSDHACVYAQYLFAILAGLPCTLGTPSVFTKYGARVHLKGMLVIGVSQSGKAEDVLEVLKSANEEGAITVAVTNNLESPMAKTAKYHLFCDCGFEASIAATKTFTTQMMLLAAIAGKWSGNVQFLENLANVHNKVAEFFDKNTAEIVELAKKYQNIPGAVILGRGISYPIALEGALKTLETNKLKMKGYPTSDFHHGPIAQVKKNDLVFVISPKGATEKDSADIIEKLLKEEADVLVVTNDAAQILPGTHGIVLPDTGCELTSPFISVLFFQMLACQLTIVRGIDPDKAGTINKITITK